jgi:(p)ppGpp synthase/HD superfamily hydrolase
MPTPQQHLYCFITLKHFEQKRKYTGEPYFQHLLAVAKMTENAAIHGYEIGLCHDLLEDTDCTDFELMDALAIFGYSADANRSIVNGVIELTDVYTHEAYPHLNRAMRKELEAERLWTISKNSQTIKYCDFIDNTKSIVQYDPGFAKVYLAEKQRVLFGMTLGDRALYDIASGLVIY